MTAYPYFPGCSLEGTAKEFDQATHAVFTQLGFKLHELHDWTCCGATSAHFKDHLLSVALPIRNINLVKRSGGSQLVASCAACFSRLKTAVHEMDTDAGLRAQVNQVTEEEYVGGVSVRHTLEVLLQDAGLEKIKLLVTKPLSGLKVVPYYGCLLVRPPKVLKFDDPENPTSMDQIIQTTGATVAPWPCKTDCCGASLTLSRADLVLELGKKILLEARDASADAIIVACPLCQANLDMRQKDLQSMKAIDFSIPVIYFTQLLGLSFGLSWAELGLGKHLVSAKPILKSVVAQPVNAPAAQTV